MLILASVQTKNVSKNGAVNDGIDVRRGLRKTTFQLQQSTILGSQNRLVIPLHPFVIQPISSRSPVVFLFLQLKDDCAAGALFRLEAFLAAAVLLFFNGVIRDLPPVLDVVVGLFELICLASIFRRLYLDLLEVELACFFVAMVG